MANSGLNAVSSAMSVAWKAMKMGFDDGVQFSPGQPLQVQGNDPLSMGPRQNQYRTGQNLNINPRAENDLTPFSILRTLADSSDLVRICINARKDQMAGLEWDIVPKNPEDTGDYKSEIDTLKEFFEYPDRVLDFPTWQGQFLEEVMVTDAPCLFRRMTRGGTLYGIEQIDGTTIKPLVDVRGRTPLPPEKAYQQILYGRVQSEYDVNELIYAPRVRRVWTQYGMSPTEIIIIKVNLALRRDDFYMRYYTKGAMPDAGLFQTETNWTPDQLAQYQELWDDLMRGNIDNRMSLRFVPKGTYTPTKEWKFESAFDEWLGRIVANAFSVSPMMFAKMMNRASGGVQEQIQNDVGLKPLIKYMENVLSRIIQIDLKQPKLKFKYIDKKADDAALEVDKNVKYVAAGIYSIDEVRQAEGKAALGIPNMIISGGAGPVFLTKDVIDRAIEGLTNPQAPGLLADTTNGSTVESSGNDSTVVQAGKKLKTDDQPAVNKVLKSEYGKFEKYAISRLGRENRRDFTSEVIDPEMLKNLNAVVSTCTTIDDIKLIFSELKNGE